MDHEHNKDNIIQSLIEKYSLKWRIFENTRRNFEIFKEVIKELVYKYKDQIVKANPNIPFDYRDKNEFHIEFTFGSDVLVFMLHSNVFEFDRNHEVRKTSYIKEDPTRSYCGNIRIYNFLSDSFKYSRLNDVGYLIARIFINKENHYFIEGKREVGMIYNNFASSEMTREAIENIIYSAMHYCMHFDLLNPPFDAIKEVSYGDMVEYSNSMGIKTGKRVGFKFQADQTQV